MDFHCLIGTSYIFFIELASVFGRFNKYSSFRRCVRINIYYATAIIIVPQIPKQFKVGSERIWDRETSCAIGTVSHTPNYMQ